MTGHEAETVTRLFWESRRAAMIEWMIKERKFNPKGAKKAADTFIETMTFVARETRVPQFKTADQ